MRPTEECEAKFPVPDADALARAPALILALGGRLGPARRVRLRDVYLDTDDRWLLRAGIGLRIRIAGRRAVLTVKTRRSPPGRLVRRVEWEEEHDARRIRLPGPLPRGRIAAWFRRSRGPVDLRPLIELDHERVQRTAVLPGGVRAKLCLDRVRLRGRGRRPGFCEVEIERLGGDPRRLRHFVRELESASGWHSDGTPKLERALQLAGVPPPGPPGVPAHRLRPGDRLGDAAWAVLRRRFDEFLWNEPGARAGLDPEFLHDMRVAARRMRAALRVFRGAVPADFAGRAETELRRIFAAMGRVRDLDVCAALLRARRQDPPDPGETGWIEWMDRRRERAWNRLLRTLGGDRYARFTAFMTEALGTPPAADAPPRAGLRAGDAARKTIRRHFRKTIEAADALGPDAPEADFHAVRIRFKKLRYALEFFADLHPGATRKLGRELAGIQDLLGEFQDEVVLRTLLREGARRGMTDAMAGVRERLEQQIAGRIADRQGRFLELRQRLRSKTVLKLAEKLGARA